MLNHGVPALTGALVSFGCVISTTMEMGSHSIFLCEVCDLALGEEDGGLVYFDRNYYQIPMRSATA